MRSPHFSKVLIANRGEIAVRVARTLRDMQIRSVAVYSNADRASLHVRVCDEAYPIGPAAATHSYLNTEALIAAARASGADAIHPGYGFLSEDADFARAVEEAGLCWIGPPPAAMDRMGDKVSARRCVSEAGVPVVPGSKPLEDDRSAQSEAERIGYPLLIKASAGGGGKGMRLVREPKELASGLRAARSEASAAFGDATVYMEKLIERPHHVEVQVLGDKLGGLIHLGERECSAQRRHQKVVEESPAPLLREETRAKLGEVAVRAARSAGYANAGTCEFLVDADQNFYFLEMNTRLQVEHPVTELRTGLDLVELQVRMAAGERLPLRQEEVTFRGHAIEARIYAEDPERGYLPAPGDVTSLREPSGPGVRVDSGIAAGSRVSTHYDPILAKLIVWGETRDQAIARMRRALGEYRIGGLVTNLSLHRRILEDARFAAGDYDTSLLETLERPSAPEPSEREAVALAVALLELRSGSERSAPAAAPAPSAWKHAGRLGILGGRR